MIDNDEYIQQGGMICPKCGSDDLTGHSIEADGNIAWQPVTCNDCEFEYRDIFRLIGYEPKG